MPLHTAAPCSCPRFPVLFWNSSQILQPPNETHRFCLVFVALGDETMMDDFIVVASMPDFSFQTHNRNTHLPL